jgi:hypothetical protein
MRSWRTPSGPPPVNVGVGMTFVVAIVVATGWRSRRTATGRQRTGEALSWKDGPGRTSADPIRTNF